MAGRVQGDAQLHLAGILQQLESGRCCISKGVCICKYRSIEDWKTAPTFAPEDLRPMHPYAADCTTGWSCEPCRKYIDGWSDELVIRDHANAKFATCYEALATTGYRLKWRRKTVKVSDRLASPDVGSHAT